MMKHSGQLSIGLACLTLAVLTGNVMADNWKDTVYLGDFQTDA